MSPTIAALILSWICIVFLALGTAGLLRRVDALERAQAGGPGTLGRHPVRVPGCACPCSASSRGRRPRPAAARRLPGCGSCRTALADLAAAQPTGPRCRRRHGGALAGAARRPARFAVAPDAGELVDILGVPATPYLVRLDADGTIRRADVVTGSTNLAAWTAPRAPLTTLVEER